MMLGIGLLEIINKVLGGGENAGKDTISVFKDPTVDLNIVFMATIILIISGLFAGYIPARKAVKIKPIDAIRSE
jgi:putative ABC transport system permease protein